MDRELIGSLASRLERLERENRRLRRGLAALGIIGLAVVLVGAQSNDRPKLVEAERVVVRGGDGQAQITLGIEPDGIPSLTFQDEGRKIRACLVVAENGTPILRYFDGDGKYLYQIPR